MILRRKMRSIAMTHVAVMAFVWLSNVYYAFTDDSWERFMCLVLAFVLPFVLRDDYRTIREDIAAEKAEKAIREATR